MSVEQMTNLFTNPRLEGSVDDHGLPDGFTLAPYEHGVHYWKLGDVRVEAHAKVLPDAGPDGMPAIRVEHQEFRLLDEWDDWLPRPGYVQWVGIRADVGRIAPAEVDRVFRLVYVGRSAGHGYVHARIQGPHLQNDPESIAWRSEWRRIDHDFILGAHETLDAVYFYVKVSEPGDVVEFGGFELVDLGEFRPDSPKGRPRLERIPTPDLETRVRINPPTLVWTWDTSETRYELELARDEAFSRDVKRFGPVEMNFFKPTEALPPGRWYWRWRKEGDTWSQAVAFDMPEDAVEYVTPSFEEIFASTRRDHPRLMVNRETLEAFRRRVTVTNAQAWEEFLGEIEEPSWRMRRQRRRRRRRRSDEHAKIWIAAQRLQNRAFAWMVTGDAEHSTRAKELLAEVFEVPFEGITRHKHSELNRNLINALAYAYDWLHDELDEAERAKTREAIARRVEDLYEFYRANRGPFYMMERMFYDSHGTYMMQTILLGALAIVHEVPEAKRWMRYWLMANISFYPPWSATDGSWAQGIHYGACYVDGNDIPESFVVRSATGLNLFEKPFFRNHRNWVLHTFPPYGTKSPFGDVVRKDEPEDMDRDRHMRIARTLAAELNDPYAKWYADTVTAINDGKGNIRRTLLIPEADHVEAKPPDDLPLARLFPDTGWVFMHTDLTGRRDVSLTFKSSPYGSFSHSHADQNSFVLSVGDRRLLTDAGYYAGYGTPHHLGFYKRTRAHNAVLVNGHGQIINEPKAGGHIARFAHTGEITYALGQAAAAYGNRLTRCDRHIIFLRPNAFVLFDDLAAPEASTFDWLLHSPVAFEIDEGARTVVATNAPAFVAIHLDGPEGMRFSVTDQFDPPVPEHYAHRREEYRNEYHFAAHAGTPATEVRFTALMRTGEGERATSGNAPTFIRDASWQGIATAEGIALLRSGPEETIDVAGRRIETDARLVVLRPDGAYLALDASHLSVDGADAFPPGQIVACRTGRSDATA